MNLVQKLIELDRAKKVRICIIGDSMTDIYIHGRFGECQDDCPKFVEESRKSCAGGARNAFESLCHWNAAVAILSNDHYIQPVKTRFLVNGKIMFRHDVDEMDVESVLQEKRRTHLKTLQESRPDAILISDYDKGFLAPEFIRQVIKLANERGIPVVADAKREPELYEGSIIKANSDYASKRTLYIPQYVITKGGEGCFVFGLRPNLYTQIKPLRSVECRNHVGAGDCFAAHLTMALAHGMTLEEAAAIAHSAGRVYVQYLHNRAPWPEEVAKDFEGNEP